MCIALVPPARRGKWLSTLTLVVTPAWLLGAGTSWMGYCVWWLALLTKVGLNNAIATGGFAFFYRCLKLRGLYYQECQHGDEHQGTDGHHRHRNTAVHEACFH